MPPAGGRPSDTYVIVGYHQEAVREHLGPAYIYVTQEEAARNGGCRAQAWRPLLQDFDGDLLILYGDTPAVQPDLDPRADQPPPAAQGQPDPADRRGRPVLPLRPGHPRPRRAHHGHHRRGRRPRSQVKEIRELNVGAYVVSASEIWPALEALRPSPQDGEYRLTASVHQLIHRGLQVESYQIYDQDEIQGINTRAGPGTGRIHPANGATSARGARKSRTTSSSAPAAGAR